MLGKSGAVKAMKEVSEEIISKIDSRGFSVGDNIDLKDSHELPYLYERGTIFYKEYKRISYLLMKCSSLTSRKWLIYMRSTLICFWQV